MNNHLCTGKRCWGCYWNRVEAEERKRDQELQERLAWLRSLEIRPE